MNSNSDRSAETASVASQAPSSWGEGYIYADAAVTALLLALAVERAFERDMNDGRLPVWSLFRISNPIKYGVDRQHAVGHQGAHEGRKEIAGRRVPHAHGVVEAGRGHVFSKKTGLSNWCRVSPLKACRRLDLKGYRHGWSPLRARIVLVVVF